MKKTTKALLILLAVGTVLIAFLAMRPRPLRVEVAPVEITPLRQVVEEDGETRVRERFEISTPVAGVQGRIDVHPGDAVRSGDVVARIRPAPLDARQTAQLEARLAAARDTLREAVALAERTATAERQAQRDDGRVQRLLRDGLVAKETAEQSAAALRQARKDAEAVTFRARAASFDVEAARAALSYSHAGEFEWLELRSPNDGFVLRVFHENESVVPAGTPLVEIGDLRDVEVVIDVLTEDATMIHSGMRVLLATADSDVPIEARVLRVEPAAFTKVSTLGVEEQRVNVIAAFDRPPAGIGDRFRIDATVVLWEGNALSIPNSALFREGAEWATYVVVKGKAEKRIVRLGRRGTERSEVTQGLSSGDAVVTYPSDELAAGDAVHLVRRTRVRT